MSISPTASEIHMVVLLLQLQMVTDEVLRAPWDLVLYKLQHRSEGFLSEGIHSFLELQRFRGLATNMIFSPVPHTQ